MNPLKDEVKKTLDELFEKAEKSRKDEDVDELTDNIEMYSDQGYRVLEYVWKRNKLAQEIREGK